MFDKSYINDNKYNKKVYLLKKKLRQRYKNIDKEGKYSYYFKKRIITFLMCYNRIIYSKIIVLSPFILKRLCYPILKLGYYIQHSMTEYNNKDNDYKYIDYLISYNFYFVNKIMLEKYNTKYKY